MIASFRARRLPSRAALLLEAAALCVCSTTTMAAVVDSPIDNLSLPNTFIGLYINVVSGAAGTSAAAGWDFNAFTNGTNLIFDWNNAPAGSAGGVANASPTGTFVGLAPGATVSAASLFATNTSATTGSPFLTTQNGYLGIRFRNEATGQVNYGYLRLTTTASSGFPATILCARYENTGAAITVATCGATADMSASLTDSPDPVAAIGTITYTATATNNGPATATNVTITLPVPVGTSFFPASPSAGGSCNAASPVVCTFTGPTAVGAANARSVVINAAVQSNTAPGTVINATASTSSPTFEPNSANNAAATTTTVGNPASLCSIATPATLPSGVPGTAYSAAITAGGGTAPYVFSKIGTGVPGLTLSSAGVLSGTPTFAGSYVFTVRAVDGANCPAARVYTVSIVSAHQCAVPTFNRLDIASANAPNAAAAGDFNDDGRSDLVVANSGNATISVMLADGVGGFTSTTLPFAAATQQNHTLATGDLDRNGQLDFVAALGSSVRVFIGNGSGGFSAPTDYPAPGSLIGVKLADFNADGNLDVTGHTFSGTVVPVLLGNGDGTLRPFTFSLATAAVSAVEVADFNGDGRLDLAAAQPTTNGVGIFLGNGNGTFQNRTSYAFGAQPVDLSTGDWNLDGRVDLAASAQLFTPGPQGRFIASLGDGAGAFTSIFPSANFGAEQTSIATLDYNGDGRADQVLQDQQFANVLFLPSNGSLFGAGTSTTNANPRDVIVGDFDGDRKQDVVSIGNSNVAVFFNQCCVAYALNPASLPNGVSGTAYPTTPFSSSGGNAPYVITRGGALPTGMSFANATLSGTPTQAGVFPITVLARDFSGCSRTLNYNLRVCNLIGVTPATLPNGTAGTAYSGATIGATGGSGSATFAVTTGALPVGLTLTTAGVLSGQPLQAGSFPFTITATDAIGCTGTRSYTLVVDKTATAIGLQSAPNPSLQGQTVTLTATVTSSATGVSPTGSVSFLDGASPIGNGTLNGSGIATLTTSTLTVGSHNLTATYAGDGVFLTSTSAVVAHTVSPAADLAITKTDGVSSVIQGQGLTYTIAVTNAGPGSATGATVTDNFPAALTSCTWTCAASVGASCTASGNGNIGDTITLPSAGTVTYTAACNVSASFSGPLQNTATVAPAVGLTDPVPGNNSAADTDTVLTIGIFSNGFE